MRKIEKIYKTIPVMEGAGVQVHRAEVQQDLEKFDPFLLFDDFTNTDASLYTAGFPKHPHRGIETVTYILKGEVHHKDSMGNEGSIKSGEIQWMTAGSGIIHEEMPIVHEEGIQGFQLWVNLPSAEKMIAPRYQEIKADEIPVVEESGALVKVIAGIYKDTKGPVQDLMVSPTYLDITLEPRTAFSLKTVANENYFAYVISGRLAIRDGRSEAWVSEGDVVLLTHDTDIDTTGGKEGTQFLLIGGKPLGEPIAWHGPIVMNTEEEIQTAVSDLQNGTFIKD